jgi:hypothetical protein
MDNIGLDRHKRESQLCVLTLEGEIRERRITTTRASFTAVLGGRPRARILLEASTESEWAARDPVAALPERDAEWGEVGCGAPPIAAQACPQRRWSRHPSGVHAVALDNRGGCEAA